MSSAIVTDPLLRTSVDAVVVSPGDKSPSASSWGAIIAGAAGASAISLILFVLGTGLGLSSISPWAQEGLRSSTLAISAIVWAIFTQLVASAIGGYLAGRLRTRWTGTHVDEVYFRDTVHGFLAWSVATLITASVLASTIGSITGTGVQAASSMAGGAASVAGTAAATSGRPMESAAGMQSSASPLGYYVDALFRRDASQAPGNGAAPATGGAAPAAATMPADNNGSTGTMGADGRYAGMSGEATRIFSNSLAGGAALPAGDSRYLGQMVATRTGLSQQDAEKRVNDVYASAQSRMRETEAVAKEAADKARKALAYASLWLFVGLLGGAFVASVAATYGGRLRDA